MGNRLSNIYTRTGDDGTTGLGDGNRVKKDSPRMEAIGTVDELNSTIGILVACELPDQVRTCLLEIQHDLFDIGGELSIPGHKLIASSHTERLEQYLDTFNNELPPLKEFILPGGNQAAAACHLSRSVCRRAERRLIKLSDLEETSIDSKMYLNRLSDLLFVVARVLARLNGGTEILWDRKRT